jgi:hypothetical protein
MPVIPRPLLADELEAARLVSLPLASPDARLEEPRACVARLRRCELPELRLLAPLVRRRLLVPPPPLLWRLLLLPLPPLWRLLPLPLPLLLRRRLLALALPLLLLRWRLLALPLLPPLLLPLLWRLAVVRRLPALLPLLPRLEFVLRLDALRLLELPRLLDPLPLLEPLFRAPAALWRALADDWLRPFVDPLLLFPEADFDAEVERPRLLPRFDVPRSLATDISPSCIRLTCSDGALGLAEQD